MMKLNMVEQISHSGSEIELLLVQVGKKQFALELADVKHILPLPYDFPCSGKATAEFYAFEGKPLRFISSWDMQEEATVYAEFSEILSILPQRRRDHIDWINELEHSIRSGSDFLKARDPHDCAFGKWYYNYRAKNRRLSMLLAGLEAPHVYIHGLADSLLGMISAGKRDIAIEKLEEAKKTKLSNLLDLFDQASQLLGVLQRRIAIILERDEITCALGADVVIDIASVEMKKVTWNVINGKSVPRIVILSDTSVVPFLPWQ